jgi:hypothetical protein
MISTVIFITIYLILATVTMLINSTSIISLST